jgi:hypothetical protein
VWSWAYKSGVAVIWIVVTAAALFLALLVYLAGVCVGAWLVMRNPPDKPLDVGPLIVAYKCPGWPGLHVHMGDFNPAYGPELIVWQWPSKLESRLVASLKKRGRPVGSLSAKGLAERHDFQALLEDARRARDSSDGSLRRFCRENDLPESTVRRLLDKH